jgi:hypothetical protein
VYSLTVTSFSNFLLKTLRLVLVVIRCRNTSEIEVGESNSVFSDRKYLRL